MSTQLVNDAAGGFGGADGLRLPQMACEAHDLKRVLTDLANRINEADQRHSKALTAMHERLCALGAAATGLRDQLPANLAPELDRIQGGMSQLAAHIAEAEAQRRNAPAARSEMHALSESAPALRSALAADALDAFARKSQSARNAGATEHDHFDVVDLSPTAREPETWDSQAAEALAQLYESGEAGPAPAPEAPVAIPDAAAAVAESVHPVAAAHAPAAVEPVVFTGPSPDEIASQIAARQAEVLENERRWLDERFSQIASRLEKSIAGIGVGGPLETLDARFAGLEQKLGEALAAAPTRADFAGLKSIETQVEDLTAQLVTVQTHFSRLDTIELELRSLAGRISNEKIAEMMESNAPKATDNDALAGAVAGVAKEMPRIEARIQSLAEQLSSEKLAALVGQNKAATVDTGAIARMVAELVSQQMPKSQPAAANHAPAIDDLRSMMETFAVEQRQGDEQIHTMLDTVQQAMIRLLDRMDALEQGRYQDTVPATGEQQAYVEQAGYGAPVAAYAPQSNIREETRIRTEAQPEYANYAAPTSYQPQSPAAYTQSEPAYQPAAADSKTAADNREDFIAAARRAARKATEAQPEQGIEATQPPPPENRKVKINPAPKSGRSLSGISMAMICLLLVGGGFAAVRSFGIPGFSQPSSSQRAPAATPAQPRKSDADKRVQNLEDADLIIEDDRKGPAARQQPAPAPQRRSSLDGNGEETGQFARNADGMVVSDIPTASLQNATALPAALTKEQPNGAAAGRVANPMPPATIGPNSLRSAAAKGDPSAEYEIGVRFAEGKGVPQDLQQAVAWYQRAAAQGFAPAQYRLGSMYERGLGLKADLARARVWYQRAAEQGVVKAMHNLAVLTAGRDNTAVDYATAARWFNAAAEHGLTDSQFNLAIMHDSGLGMERDSKQAYKWFSLAARAGDDEASRRRESLRAKLAPNEVQEVENEIKMWRPKQAAAVLNDPRQAGEMWKQRSR